MPVETDPIESVAVRAWTALAVATAGLDTSSLADRVAHVVQSAFAGRRIVIFSGGPTRDDDHLLDEVRQIHAGGGFGSIVGRNAFQRPRERALSLLEQIANIHMGRA